MIFSAELVTNSARLWATIIITRIRAHIGCTQIANQLSDCVPPIPSSVLGITENDTWQSLRVGVNGEIMITDRFKLGADIAYLPFVQFNGTDDHLQRSSPFHISRIGHGNRIATRKHSFLSGH